MKSPDPNSILKVISDDRCIEIIKIITMEASYSKEIAGILNIKESRVSEKMRILKEAGFVDEEWRKLNGKMVKYFKPGITYLKITFSNGNVDLKVAKKGHAEEIRMEPLQDDIPPVDYFVGRKRELEFLNEHKRVFVAGIPGIGKTTVVSKYVSQGMQKTFWHEIREVDTLKHVLSKIAIFLEYNGRSKLQEAMKNERDRRTQINLALSSLRDLDATVVFDDIQNCRDPDLMNMIVHFTRSVPELHIIIIGRQLNQSFNMAVNAITIGELEREDVYKFLGNLKESRKIYNRIGGFPLLLKLVKENNTKINNSDFPDSFKKYIVEGILPQLEQHMRYTIEKISFIRGWIDLKEAQLLFGKFQVSELLRAEEMGLLKIDRNTIKLNDLVRESIYSNAANKQDTHFAIAKYYISMGDGRSVIEGLYHLARSGRYSDLLNLIDANFVKLSNEGFISNLKQELIDIQDNLEICDIKSWILQWIGRIYLNERKYDSSLDYLSKARRCPHDNELEIELLQREAAVFQFMGKLEMSESKYVAAIKLGEITGSNKLPRLMAALGYLLFFMGRLAEAKELLSKSIRLSKSSNDERTYYSGIFSLAKLNFLMGNMKEANSLNDSAADGFLKMNFYMGYAATLQSKGIFYMTYGNLNKAKRCFEEVIKIIKNTGYSYSDRAYTFIQLAIIETSLNNFKKADDYIKRARRSLDISNDVLLKGLLYLGEGILLSRKEVFDKAERKLRKSIEYISSDPITMYRANRDLGLLLIRTGRYDEGLELLDQHMKFLLKFEYLSFYNESRKIIRREIKLARITKDSKEKYEFNKLSNTIKGLEIH